MNSGGKMLVDGGTRHMEEQSGNGKYVLHLFRF